MPDEQTPQLRLATPPDGVKHIYANVSHLNWTGMDLTVQLYQIVQPNRDLPSEKTTPNDLMHEASVTFTWPAAKNFHKFLGDVLERYEKVYGSINTEFKPI